MPNFPEMVISRFGFLAAHGYRHEVKGDGRVQYWGPQAIIELYCGGRGEVDLVLDQNPPKHRFQLRLFLMAFFPDEEKQLRECIASNDDEVGVALDKLASVLQRCGARLVAGDRDLFDHMATVKWWELPGYKMERKTVPSSQSRADARTTDRIQPDRDQRTLF